MKTTNSSLAKMAGQLIVGGFEGTTPQKNVTQRLSRGEIGGCILFKRNLESMDQILALNQKLHNAGQKNNFLPFVAVDQEGGRVQRIKEGVTLIPAMGKVGAANDPELALALGKLMALELKTLGFNINFAPVLDLDTNPNNPIIGDRAFSSKPDVVAAMASGITLGHLINGVLPCGKHFPGHGDTSTDSHLTLPVIRHSLRILKSREMIPFALLISRGLPMIMTAHIHLPKIDPDNPATLSPKILRMLREELQFRGIIVSDDLEMAALNSLSVEEIVYRGIEAGIDLFLICRSVEKQVAAFEAIINKASRDKTFYKRVQKSFFRIQQLKMGFLKPWTNQNVLYSCLGCKEHRNIVSTII